MNHSRRSASATTLNEKKVPAWAFAWSCVGAWDCAIERHFYQVDLNSMAALELELCAAQAQFDPDVERGLTCRQFRPNIQNVFWCWGFRYWFHYIVRYKHNIMPGLSVVVWMLMCVVCLCDVSEKGWWDSAIRLFTAIDSDTEDLSEI